MAHQHLIFDEYEAMEGVSAKGKITFFIATSQGRLDLLAWSVLGLLLRTPETVLDRVFVVINGDRYKAEHQDAKERFLRALCLIDPRVTPIRLLGHVAHSQCMDMCVPWCNSEYYAIMHDDVLIRTRGWTSYVLSQLTNPLVDAIVYPNFLGDGTPIVHMCGIRDTVMGGEHAGKKVLITPHPCTALTVCKAVEMAKLGGRWRGYHIWLPGPTMLNTLVDIQALVAYWWNRGLVEADRIDIHTPYSAISHDVGTWLWYRSLANGHTWAQMPRDIALHIERASWEETVVVDRRIHQNMAVTEDIKAEIKASRYYNLYLTHIGNIL